MGYPCSTLLGSHLIWNVVTGMMVETSLPLVFFVVGFVVLCGSHAERLMGALQYGACLLFSTFVPGTMISMGALFFYISTQREKFLYVWGVWAGWGGGEARERGIARQPFLHVQRWVQLFFFELAATPLPPLLFTPQLW